MQVYAPIQNAGKFFSEEANLTKGKLTHTDSREWQNLPKS